MNNHKPFLDAILADPENNAPRLIYADWLEEQGNVMAAGWRMKVSNYADTAKVSLGYNARNLGDYEAWGVGGVGDWHGGDWGDGSGIGTWRGDGAGNIHGLGDGDGSGTNDGNGSGLI